jgi:hypothetical protein
MADPINPEAAINDQLAVTRTLPILDAAAIPEAPEGYVPTTTEYRAKALRKVDERLEAELHDALTECGKRGTDLAKELSTLAPPSEKAKQLADELGRNKETLARAEYLVQYLKERRSILLSDGVIYLERIKEQLDHHAKFKPHLSMSYSQTNEFFEARSASISEGIAEAKKKRAATPTPAPAPTEEPK